MGSKSCWLFSYRPKVLLRKNAPGTVKPATNQPIGTPLPPEDFWLAVPFMILRLNGLATLGWMTLPKFPLMAAEPVPASGDDSCSRPTSDTGPDDEHVEFVHAEPLQVRA